MAYVDPALFRSLCRARELLREDALEPLTVEEVAHRVAVSPFHFIRRFDEVFGLTPNRFRTRARIERAKELLAIGEHSVTEVCMEVGFSSLGSFSVLFKRCVGATPSAYRRRTRVLVQVPGVLPPALAPPCLGLMGELPPGLFRSFREA
jgi:AraC-like DNA-binding protein